MPEEPWRTVKYRNGRYKTFEDEDASNAVKYVAQSPTVSEQAIARQNINAVDEDSVITAQEINELF